MIRGQGNKKITGDDNVSSPSRRKKDSPPQRSVGKKGCRFFSRTRPKRVFFFSFLFLCIFGHLSYLYKHVLKHRLQFFAVDRVQNFRVARKSNFDVEKRREDVEKKEKKSAFSKKKRCSHRESNSRPLNDSFERDICQYTQTALIFRIGGSII